MSLSLPSPIAAYFEASGGLEISKIIRCFTSDAVVTDEGQTHIGHDAIELWKIGTRQKFTYTTQPIHITSNGSTSTVTVIVAGNFPGSPVQLDHAFELSENRIKSLRIYPCL